MTPVGLRSWRKSAGLTQAKLASLLGVSRSNIIRWERGQRSIPPYLGYALAAIDKGLEPVG